MANSKQQTNAAGMLEMLQGLKLLPPDSAPAHDTGVMFWDTAALGPAVHMGPAGVTMSIGLESYELVYNDSGAQIDDGEPVYRSGVDATNGVSEISLSRADDVIKALSFMGVTTHDIPNGSLGLVTVRGKVRDINTIGLVTTGPLYLGATGGFTNAKLTAPNSRVVVGGAITIHASEGCIQVAPSLALQPTFDTKDFHYRSVGSGIQYRAGFYDAPVAAVALTQASLTVTHGVANQAWGAHAFIVAAAAGSVDAGQVGLRVNGISITDAGVRTAGDTEELTDDITSLATDQYLETTKKWLGAPEWELFVVTPTPTAYSLTFNYGMCKYEDRGNRDFTIADFEVSGDAGATDSGFDVELLHHKPTGWTYHATAFVPGDGAIAQWTTDMSPDDSLINGEPFAWKHVDLFDFIQGQVGHEGYLIRITTTQPNTVQALDAHVSSFIELT